MTKLPVSPLAPASFPELAPVSGVRFATARTGTKYKDRDDLLLAALDEGTTVAGVLTRNVMPGAPVVRCRRLLPRGEAGALLVNAGIANVFTGSRGLQAVEATASATARLLGLDAERVFTASTGVIGEPLPDDAITATIATLHDSFGRAGWLDAAHAIGTTDTFPKGAGQTAEIDGAPVTIAGIAKGSGMIAPDMATMLAFIFTDAAISAPALQALLEDCNRTSLNCVTVDGDTSTSDTCLLFATGKAGNTLIEDAGDARLDAFRAGLQNVMDDLAELLARDGEGASKLITIHVTGAETDEAARRIGLSIGNSPLVKTAIAGEDANWGRIVMAVGKAGEKADRDRLSIEIGGVPIAMGGQRDPDYVEADVMPHMKGREIDIRVDIGIGGGAARIWSCDLTHGYIDINADYRS